MKRNNGNRRKLSFQLKMSIIIYKKKPSFSCSFSCTCLTECLLLVLESRRARQRNRFTPREMINATTKTMFDITKAAT